MSMRVPSPAAVPGRRPHERRPRGRPRSEGPATCLGGEHDRHGHGGDRCDAVGDVVRDRIHLLAVDRDQLVGAGHAGVEHAAGASEVGQVRATFGQLRELLVDDRLRVRVCRRSLRPEFGELILDLTSLDREVVVVLRIAILMHLLERSGLTDGEPGRPVPGAAIVVHDELGEARPVPQQPLVLAVVALAEPLGHLGVGALSHQLVLDVAQVAAVEVAVDRIVERLVVLVLVEGGVLTPDTCHLLGGAETTGVGRILQYPVYPLVVGAGSLHREVELLGLRQHAALLDVRRCLLGVVAAHDVLEIVRQPSRRQQAVTRLAVVPVRERLELLLCALGGPAFDLGANVATLAGGPRRRPVLDDATCLEVGVEIERGLGARPAALVCEHLQDDVVVGVELGFDLASEPGDVLALAVAAEHGEGDRRVSRADVVRHGFVQRAPVGHAGLEPGPRVVGGLDLTIAADDLGLHLLGRPALGAGPFFDVGTDLGEHPSTPAASPLNTPPDQPSSESRQSDRVRRLLVAGEERLGTLLLETAHLVVEACAQRLVIRLLVEPLDLASLLRRAVAEQAVDRTLVGAPFLDGVAEFRHVGEHLVARQQGIGPVTQLVAIEHAVEVVLDVGTHVGARVQVRVRGLHGFHLDRCQPVERLEQTILVGAHPVHRLVHPPGAAHGVEARRLGSPDRDERLEFVEFACLGLELVDEFGDPSLPDPRHETGAEGAHDAATGSKERVENGPLGVVEAGGDLVTPRSDVGDAAFEDRPERCQVRLGILRQALACCALPLGGGARRIGRPVRERVPQLLEPRPSLVEFVVLPVAYHRERRLFRLVELGFLFPHDAIELAPELGELSAERSGLP